MDAEGTSTKDGAFSLQHDFPLHFLAKTGNHEELKKYFELQTIEAANQLTRFDFKGRTVLHYAVTAVNLTDGEKCVKLVIDFLNELEKSENRERERERFRKIAIRRHTQTVRRTQWKSDVGESTTNFINQKDVDGETAIHLAAKNENAKIVEVLLLNSAEVLHFSKSGEQTLNLIYSKTPSAVTALLNKSVSFDYGVDSESFIKSERSYCLDLTAVIGDTDDAKGQYNETLCLHTVNENETAARRQILMHPLVRFFVEKKFTKFQWIIWASLLIKLFWIILYLWHAISIYSNCCDLTHIYNKLTSKGPIFCSKYPFDQALNVNWTETDRTVTYEAVIKCIDQNNYLGRTIVIFILTAFVLITVIFQLVFLRMSYLKINNVFLWTFIILQLITIFPSKGNFKLQFEICAFTILVAGLVILELINKHIYWGIYIRVLIKVIKRFLAILPLFLFIILVFSISLQMLFPDLNPVMRMRNLRDLIMEVFAAVANGKVEWTEGDKYKVSIDSNFPASGFIMFISFYVIMILLLFRILIGFVVADTKKIQEEEELNEISQDLEQIFVFESFMISKLFRWFASFECLRILLKIRQKFMLCPEGKLELWLSESKIPQSLRKQMREIASKIPVKPKKTDIDNNNSFESTDI